jgi:hypothetical protein
MGASEVNNFAVPHSCISALFVTSIFDWPAILQSESPAEKCPSTHPFATAANHVLRHEQHQISKHIPDM